MRVTGRIAAAVIVLSCLLGATPAATEPIPSGPGRQTVELNGTPMVVFTYRPAGCSDPSLLLVFHGVARNAADYRDDTRVLADRNCLLVVAPLFDKRAFPLWRYQRGGIVKDGVIQSPNIWTGQLVLALVDWARRQEGRPLAYSLIGHSAGGQFLDRLAAFVPTEASRIVVADPGSYVFRAWTSKRRTAWARSIREWMGRRSCGAIWNSPSPSISEKAIPARTTATPIRQRWPRARLATNAG